MHMRAYPTELDGKRGEREASRRQFMLSQQAEDARRREMQQQAWERGTATGASYRYSDMRAHSFCR